MGKYLPVIPLLFCIGCSQTMNPDELMMRNQFVATSMSIDTAKPQTQVLSMAAAQSNVTVEPWQTLLLRRELHRLTERFHNERIATPVLIASWPGLDGVKDIPQEHWFIVMGGKPYWQWTSVRFGENHFDSIWIDAHMIDMIFPDQFSFKENVVTPEPAEIHQSGDWEFFDGETLEPLRDPERDWLLQRSPAEALQLQQE